MDGIRKIENAGILLGQDLGGATIFVMASETRGETFSGFGIDETGVFLEGRDGRTYLGEDHYANALMATEQNVVTVLEFGEGRSERQYQVENIGFEAAPGMGSP